MQIAMQLMERDGLTPDEAIDTAFGNYQRKKVMLKRSRGEHLQMAAKWEQRAAKELRADKRQRLKQFAHLHRLLVDFVEKGLQ